MEEFEKAVMNKLIIEHDCTERQALHIVVKGGAMIEQHWISGNVDANKIASKLIKKTKF